MSTKKNHKNMNKIHNKNQNPSSMGRRAFNTAMAVAFALNPFINIAQAAEEMNNNIIRTDGTRIDFQDNVANIYAEQIANDTAMNRFQSFDVAPNNIANMYFKTQENGPEASALLNFVQDRINVAGVVNALKDNKIGGNLYFFSPQGMVISSTGVINAGKLVTATPTEEYLQHMMKGNDNQDGINIFTAGADQINTILNSTTADKLVADMPINSTGTITIEGTVNVANVAKFMADKANFVDGSMVRSAMDFSQIANVGQANQTNFSSDAKRLTLSKDEEGGIVIQGGSEINVNKGATLDANKSKVVFQSKKTATMDLTQDKEKDAKLLNNESAKANTVINIDGNVSGGDMEFTADAETTFKGNVFNAPAEKKDAAKDAAKADVKKDAAVAKDANKAADTVKADKKEKSEKSLGDKISDTIVNTKGGKALSDKAKALFDKINVLTDEAEGAAQINIGKTANINSSGSIKTKATSTVNNELKITVQPTVGKAGKDAAKDAEKAAKDVAKAAENNAKAKDNKVTKSYLAGAATYNDSKSTAVVNVYGNVKAAKDITMDAEATNKTTVTTTIKKANGTEDGSAYMNAVVNVVGHNTTATVNLGKEGEANNVISAGGDFKSEAITNTYLNIDGTTAVDNRAVASTAVNIVGTRTNADVNVNTRVEGKNVTTEAHNKYSKLDIKTNNGFEKAAEAKKDAKKDDKKADVKAEAKQDTGKQSAAAKSKDAAKNDSKTEDKAAKEESTVPEKVIDMEAAPPAAEGDNSAAEGLSELMGRDTKSGEIAGGILGANKNADAKKAATSGDSEAVKAAKGTAATDKATVAPKSDKTQKKAAWNQYVDIGAAVSVTNLDNKSTVTIGKEGKLVARDGNVKANADIDMVKSNIKLNNTVVNTSKDTKLGAGAAVGVKNVHNDATVVLAGGQTKHEAVEAKKGTATLNAHIASQDEIAAQAAASTKLAEKKDAKAGDKTAQAESKKDIKAADSKKADKKDNKAAKDSKDTKDAKAADKKSAELPVSLNGTVVIENTTSNANVYMGKNTKITAQTKATLKAQVEGKDTMQAGKELKVDKKDKTTPTDALETGSQVGIGGTVGVQNAYLNSKVEIAQGAEIDAGHVDLDSDNTVTNTLLSAGGSTTSKAGINGMVAYMGGESNSRVMIDKNAIINGSVYGEGDDATDGVVSINATNNTTLKDNAGVINSSKGSSLGAAVAVVSYDLLAEAKVGEKNAPKGSGSIAATDVKVTATNNSTINNKSAAGVAAGEAAKKAEASKDSKETGAKKDGSSVKDVASAMDLQVRDKKSQGSDSKEKTVSLGKQHLTADGKTEDAAPAPLADADTAIAKDAKGNADVQSKEKTEKQKKAAAHVNLDAAGSVSWNDVKTSTIADVSGVTIKGKGDKASLQVKAVDNTKIFANSGATATVREGKDGDKGFSGNLAGAVGGNDVARTVDAHISNVDMENMASITKKAESHNVLWASGQSTGNAQKAGAGINASVSANVNYVDSYIGNLMENVNVNKNSNKKLEVENVAVDNDIQVAGSLSYDKTSNTAGAGAAVTINKISNKIDSRIIGGQLGNEKSNVKVRDLAITKLTQVGLAGSVGVAKGDAAKAGIHGAVAANTIKNDTVVRIEDATIYANDEDVLVATNDAALEKEADKSTEENTSLLEKIGEKLDFSKIADALGKDASIAKDKDGNAKSDKKSGTKFDVKKFVVKGLESTGSGNRIVTGALSGSLAKTQAAKAEAGQKADTKAADAGKDAAKTAKASGNSGNAALAGAVSYTNIEDNASALITGSKIVGNKVEALANTKTVMINAAAGGAIATGAKGMAGAGSVAIQGMKNTTKALIENSNITANKVDAKATNDSVAITAAGQATFDKGNAALGMSWAQNDVQNITFAKILGSTITAKNEKAGVDVDVKANNNSKIWAVAASAGAAVGKSSGITVEGAFAGNTGTNDTEALVDSDTKSRSTITKAKNVDVKANSNTTQKAIAGNVGLSTQNAAIGGAVAVNRLGTSAKHQAIKGQINNTDITTIGEGAHVDAKASDNDTIATIAAGGSVKAGSKTGVTVQGSVTVTDTHKDSTALMDNSTVDKKIGGRKANRINIHGFSLPGKYKNTNTIGKALVDVKAESKADVTTAAVALGVAAGGTGAGNLQAGVSIVNMDGNTVAKVKNSTMYVKNLDVKAHADNKLMNIGIGLGVAAAGTGAANAGGNVGVNSLNNNVEAKVEGSTIDSDENVVVKADNDSTVRNYGGGVGLAVAGTGAGGAGATVAVNKIGGNTDAKVEGSKVTALGKGDAVTVTEYANNKATGQVEATTLNKKGLVVTADSKQELHNVSLTVGAAAAGTAAGNLDATVSVNKISGHTNAQVLNTLVNENMAKKDATDVAVLAHDDTRIESVVGTASAGVAGVAGVAGAAAVDNNTFSRETLAQVDKDGNRGQLNARSLSVKAAAVANNEVQEHGVSIGGGGTVGVGLTGSVSVNKFTGLTKAAVNNMDIVTQKDADIQAVTNKETNTSTGSYAASVGTVAVSGAASVTTVRDTSTTIASLTNSKVRSDGDVKVKANNVDVLATQGIAASAALGIGAGAGANVTVNSMKNTVAANVENNDIEAKRGEAAIDAENNMALRSTNTAAGAGLVGAGVGVTVNNVHSGATVNIDKTNIKAQDIDVRANEKRLLDAKGLAGGAGLAGITTNVNINNLGTALAESYSYGKNGEKTFDTKDLRTKVEQGLETADKAAASLATQGYDDEAASNKEELTNDAAWNGKAAPAEGGNTTNITNSNLTASRRNNLLTDANTDGTVDMKQGAAGGLGANVSVGITTIKNNNKVNIKGSNIEGLKVDVKARSDGNLQQEVQQGAVAGYAANAAVSRISRSGENQVNIEGSSIKAVRENGTRDDSNLSIKAEDAAKLNNEVKSAAVGGITGGAMVATVKDGTNNTVNINDSKLSHLQKNGSRTEYKDIDLVADNATQAVAKAKTGSVGLVSGNYAVADATIGNKEHTAGITGVNIGKNNVIDAANINIRNNNRAEAVADTGSNGVGLATGGGATSTAQVYATNRTSLGDGTVLRADNVNLDTRNSSNAQVDAQGSSISLAAIKANTAAASLNNDITVDVGRITFQRHGEKGQVIDRGGNMNIIAQDASTGKADIKSMNVGGLVSKGTNVANTATTNNIKVNMDVDELAADNLTIKAGSKVLTVAKAQSQSGGLAAIDPRAAVVDNKTKTTTNIKLSGNFDITNDVNAEALNENDNRMLADAMQVSGLGVGGTAAANEADNTAHVDISQATIKAGGKVNTGSRNNYSFGAADGGKYVIKGKGKGVANVQVAQIKNAIKDKATTDLGNVDAKGEQTYWADGTNKIGNNTYVYAAGAVSGNAVNAAGLSMDVDNTINQHAGTKLKGEKDIAFAASSINNVSNNAMAENSKGLASGVNAYAGNNIRRSNVVNIDGEVDTKGEVKFLANKGANNELGSLDLDTSAEVYNQSFISTGSTPTLENKLSQTNRVNINGKVKADKDVTYYSDSGEEKIATYAGKSTFMSDEDQEGYVARTDGKPHVEEHKGRIVGGQETKDNQVVVNGSVTVGKRGVQKVVIGDDNMVVLTKDEYSKSQDYYKAQHKEMPKNYVVLMSDEDYDKLNEEDKNNKAFRKLSQVLQLLDADGKPVADSDVSVADFKLSTYKYTEKLLNRADELARLMKQYEGTDAYHGYKAEYNNLMKIINNSYVVQRDASGRVYAAGDVNVKALDLANLSAEGSNINITTDNLSGTGTMTAYGNPDITVDNKTSLALNVHNIQVGKAGGNVYYNGKAMTSTEAIARANEDNSLSIGELHVTDGRAGNINIIGRHTSSAVAATDAVHYMENGQERLMPIMSDINVRGKVHSKDGRAIIESKGDSINLEKAEVISRYNEFHAKKKLYQQYTAGIQNVNGSPDVQFRDAYKGGYKNTNGVETVQAQGSDGRTGMIMGEDVIINAADVNINGKIQSGFDKHYVTISKDTRLNKDNTLDTSNSPWGTRTVETRMAEIRSNNKLTELSDSQVVGNDTYCVVAGSHTYNEAKGYYEDVVPVYYNPVTNKLITGDANNRGGNVSITGRILSTGQGNIYCMDGTADIKVDNRLDNELVIGNMTTDHVKGAVTINDVAQGRSMEFTRGEDGKSDVKVYNLNSPDELIYDTATQGWNNQSYATKDGDNMYYSPVKGLRYSWTEGKTEDKTDYYTRATGSIVGIDVAKVDKYKNDAKLDKVVLNDSRNKGQGYYIGVDEKNQEHAADQMYVVHNYSKNNVKEENISHKVEKVMLVGRIHIWKDKESYSEDYANTYSIKADNPIQIKFIGHADGNNKTEIIGNGDITLAGDVGNTHLYNADGGIQEKGDVTIQSVNGSINRIGGSIYGDKVTLGAAGDMKDVAISAGDEVKLNVLSYQGLNDQDRSRNLDINVEGRFGAKGNIILTGERTLPENNRSKVYNSQEAWNRSLPWMMMGPMPNYLGGAFGRTASSGNNTPATKIVASDRITINANGAQGNITTDKGAFLDANTISLMSSNGSIRADVKGGQLVDGTNANNASVNAIAAGDVQLTQTQGDLLAGHILSYNGQVQLNTSKDGKVVNGITYKLDEATENTFLSKWRSMGMLGDETSAADKAMLEAKQQASGGKYQAWNKEQLLEAAATSSQNTQKVAKDVQQDVNIQAEKVTINGEVQDEGKNQDGINTSLNSSTKKVRTYSQVNQQELEANKSNNQ